MTCVGEGSGSEAGWLGGSKAGRPGCPAQLGGCKKRHRAGADVLRWPLVGLLHAVSRGAHLLPRVLAEAAQHAELCADGLAGAGGGAQQHGVIGVVQSMEGL